MMIAPNPLLGPQKSAPVRRAAMLLGLIGLGLAACNAGQALGGKSYGSNQGDAVTSTTGVVSPQPADPNTIGGGSPLAPLPGAGFTAAQDGNAIVVYWGQNETGQEPDLATMCLQSQYSTIIISFAYAFGGSNSQDPNHYPSLNFGTHCTTPFSDAHPTFLTCPLIAEAISVCQNSGKKILLSMGGAVGTYGFASDAEGQQMAQIIWDTFLGGQDPMRPFGTAVLDGIDLDIEKGSAKGYAVFAETLKTLMHADTRKTYYLTAAPQCPYPDPYLGPGATTALGETPSSFDFLYVQFYNNNSCETSSPQGWPTALGAWTGLNNNGGPKIFMGLPATADAANEGYLDPANAASVISSLKASTAVGGIMLWDGSYDTQSSGPYSLTMQNLLKAQAR
jgi:chitinase